MRIILAPLALAGVLGAASPALAGEDTQYWQTATVNVALPDIQESLNFSDAGLSWVVDRKSVV